MISANEAEANDVLALALSIARDNAEVFVGRKTPKAAQAVAEGVAVADEPPQNMSLTMHRFDVLAHVAHYVRESGRRNHDARALFRQYFSRTAVANGVNPVNMAFNAK